MGTFTSNGATLTVTGGAPTVPSFAVSMASPVVAGSVGTGTVRALDSYLNFASDYNGLVLVKAVDDAGAVCTAAAVKGGVGQFSCTFKRSGLVSVQASDGAGITGTGKVQVSAAATSAFIPSIGALAVAGSSVTGAIATADVFGNPTTDYSSAAQVTSSDPGAVCSAGKFTNGAGSYSCVFKSLGLQTVQVADVTGAVSQGQTSVTVIANPLLAATPGAEALDDFVFLNSKTLQLTSTAPGVAFSALSDSPWLRFTASAASTPAVLQVSGDNTGLAAGNYQGSIVVTAPTAANSPLVIPVTFTEGPDPPGQTVIASAASLGLTSTAPNSILTLFAPALACATQPQVLVNGVAASILYAGAAQINLVVPGSLTGTSALIEAFCDGASLAKVTTPLATATPALFTQTQTGTGQASIVNADGTVNAAGNAALRGGYISVFGTGFGALNAPSSDGLRRLTKTVTATIGGVPVSVLYAGEVPGLTSGLQQINVQVPSTLPAGAAVPITLFVNSSIATQSGTTVALQ